MQLAQYEARWRQFVILDFDAFRPIRLALVEHENVAVRHAVPLVARYGRPLDEHVYVVFERGVFVQIVQARSEIERCTRGHIGQCLKNLGRFGRFAYALDVLRQYSQRIVGERQQILHDQLGGIRRVGSLVHTLPFVHKLVGERFVYDLIVQDDQGLHDPLVYRGLACIARYELQLARRMAYCAQHNRLGWFGQFGRHT